MKILYAIQGTGNGHVSRAHDIIPELTKYATVDLLLSGNQCDINLPWPIKYRFKGLSFVFGKNGGINIFKTIININLLRLVKEILKVPVHKYDLVLNDFEPVTAWACNLRLVKCVAISHQYAVTHPQAAKPAKTDITGKLILKYYAPAHQHYGFHFTAIDNNIFTPVIRSDIQNAQPTNKGHYTVYLPSVGDEKIVRLLKNYPDIEWQVFSKHAKKPKKTDNIYIEPVNKQRFANSLISCCGIICNAGFETPAEALYLGKKLLVVPMRGQYEQACNAAQLKQLGVLTTNNLFTNSNIINNLIELQTAVKQNYINNTNYIINKIITEHKLQKFEFYPAFIQNNTFKTISKRINNHVFKYFNTKQVS